MKDIATFDTGTFLRTFMRPEGEMPRIVRDFLGQFFIVPVQGMVCQTKLPVPPTKSTTHTLIYLTEGEANMKIGYQAYCIGPQECLVVGAGQVFSFDRPDENKGYILNFGNDILVGSPGRADILKEFDFLNAWGQPWICLEKDNAIAVEANLSRMDMLFRSHGLQELELIQAYLGAFLQELKHAQAAMSPTPNRRAAEITRRFKELLFEQIYKAHQVNIYADQLHISANHLNKILKATTGKTPSRWIDETLVTQAKVLLFQTNDSVGEIATALGIDDSSYFSRLFKKVEGCSPQAFRKMIDLS